MKKAALSSVAALFITILAVSPAIASEPNFSKPQAFPSGIYIQPSQTSIYAPTPIPKGAGFYTEFANVPDYASFAKMNSANYIYYDTKYADFYYLDNINQVYSYSSKIFDYFKVEPKRLSEYKAYLVRLGFEQSDLLAQLLDPDNSDEPEEFLDNPQYIQFIQEDILFDPDFAIDPKGVYSIDTEFGYTVLVFGDSKNYNGGQSLESCNEIRLYNLVSDFDVMGNIMKYAGDFKIDERIFYYYVPERRAYIPFSAQTINSYIQDAGPIVSEDSIGDYMERMLQYVNGGY